MRDFSWKYFIMTGDVDAYLLYREMDGDVDDEEEVESQAGYQEEQLLD